MLALLDPCQGFYCCLIGQTGTGHRDGFDGELGQESKQDGQGQQQGQKKQKPRRPAGEAVASSLFGPLFPAFVRKGRWLENGGIGIGPALVSQGVIVVI